MKNSILILVFIVITAFSCISVMDEQALSELNEEISLRDALPSNIRLQYPVDMSKYYDANPYGNITKYGIHLGSDLNKYGPVNCDLGDTIYCIGSGMVIECSDPLIVILHRIETDSMNYIISSYYHCDTIFVTPNDYVSKGQPIALIGKKWAYTAHLHFEILTDTTQRREFYFDKDSRVDDYRKLSCIDPMKFIKEYKPNKRKN